MGNFLSLIPRNMLAFLAIAAGMAVIILGQPPHSVCDSQFEVLNHAQASFLLKDPKSKAINTTRFQRLRDQCIRGNSPGDCYELFQGLKAMLHDLSVLPNECNADVGDLGHFKSALWDSSRLLVNLAWGEKPPASYANKYNWLDTADVSLFCRLRDRVIAVYTESQWATFRDKMMLEFPGAKDLTRNAVWDLSLFSVDCTRYP